MEGGESQRDYRKPDTPTSSALELEFRVGGFKLGFSAIGLGYRVKGLGSKIRVMRLLACRTYDIDFSRHLPLPMLFT